MFGNGRLEGKAVLTFLCPYVRNRIDNPIFGQVFTWNKTLTFRTPGKSLRESRLSDWLLWPGNIETAGSHLWGDYSAPHLLYLCKNQFIRKMDNDSVNEPLEAYSQPLNFNQVWLMFQETNLQFKETKAQIKENDRMLSERFKETDKKIKELSALFTSQWGKLVESLVEGDLINLLNEKGIEVQQTLQRVKGNKDGQNYEFDIIAVNGHELVIVEVKTTLRVDDVNDFHEKLWKAKRYMPDYTNKIIYGGVAFITADSASDRMAEKLGFFVIRATGNSSSIINQKDFKPKAF